jgi:hypothetical protein
MAAPQKFKVRVVLASKPSLLTKADAKARRETFDIIETTPAGAFRQVLKLLTPDEQERVSYLDIFKVESA